MFEMSIGNIDRGNRKMLNKDKETKAVFASSTLFSSVKTKQANDTSATF